jgi:hypothetical protein
MSHTEPPAADCVAAYGVKLIQMIECTVPAVLTVGELLQVLLPLLLPY